MYNEYNEYRKSLNVVHTAVKHLNLKFPIGLHVIVKAIAYNTF